MSETPGHAIGFGRRRRRDLPFSVRSAVAADAGAVAALCVQAGFTVTAQEVLERLDLLGRLGAGSVMVACGIDGGVLGWLHVAPHCSLHAPLQAEIRGLIVDRGARGARIGSALLGAAELWAREHRLGLMRVHADAAREEADDFYRCSGFVRQPEPAALHKALGQATKRTPRRVPGTAFSSRRKR